MSEPIQNGHILCLARVYLKSRKFNRLKSTFLSILVLNNVHLLNSPMISYIQFWQTLFSQVYFSNNALLFTWIVKHNVGNLFIYLFIYLFLSIHGLFIKRVEEKCKDCF